MKSSKWVYGKPRAIPREVWNKSDKFRLYNLASLRSRANAGLNKAAKHEPQTEEKENERTDHQPRAQYHCQPIPRGWTRGPPGQPEGRLERAMRELDRYLDRYEQAESTQDMINNLNCAGQSTNWPQTFWATRGWICWPTHRPSSPACPSKPAWPGPRAGPFGTHTEGRDPRSAQHEQAIQHQDQDHG